MCAPCQSFVDTLRTPPFIAAEEAGSMWSTARYLTPLRALKAIPTPAVSPCCMCARARARARIFIRVSLYFHTFSCVYVCKIRASARKALANAQARLRRPSAEALAAAPSGALSESRKSFLRFLSPHLPRSQATAHTTSQTLFQNSGRVHVQLSGSSSPHLVPETSRMQAGTLPASSRVLDE